MAAKIVCPDCGGVIGTAERDEPSCTCFSGASKSDTATLDTPRAPSTEKICASCGNDVAGKKRYKDSRGYICYECAKAEREAERAGTVPCGECGRRVKPEGLIAYGGVKICKKCHTHHKETTRKRVKKVATRGYDIYEKQRVIVLAAVLGLVALILVWTQFF